MGGAPPDTVFNVKYIGYIVVELYDLRRVSTATFINERNCLVPRDQAKKIENGRRKYLVETPESLEQNTYSIYKVLYKDAEDEIAAYWAVVQVSYKILIDHMILRKVVYNRNIYLKYHFFCCELKEYR